MDALEQRSVEFTTKYKTSKSVTLLSNDFMLMLWPTLERKYVPSKSGNDGIMETEEDFETKEFYEVTYFTST